MATVGDGQHGYLGLHVFSMELRKGVDGDGRAAFPPDFRCSGGHSAGARIGDEFMVRPQQQCQRLVPLIPHAVRS